MPEFAFIGRSNVGKSSLINMLTNRKDLARISSTPGKTQLINHFMIDKSWYLVDLPGYGWAKISKKLKKDLDSMITRYISTRSSLICTFVLIDSRHKMQRADQEFLFWLGHNLVPFTLVFTKADKLGTNAISGSIDRFKSEFLEEWSEFPEYFVTSSKSRKGREQILDYIRDLIPG